GFEQNGEVFRVSQGLARAVKPDRLSNYEIGTKGSLAGGVLTYDLAAYYIDWKDTVQVVASIIPAPPGSVAGDLFFNGAVNSEGVAGLGVDAVLAWRVTDRLRLTGSLSWNDLGFTDDVLTAGNILYPKDSRPPESSQTTAGASLDYSFALGDTWSGQF